MLETFHFLRPEWFIAMPFIAVLLFLRVKHSRQKSGWEDVCDPILLQYQLAQQTNAIPSSSLHLLNWTVPIIFFISIIALAGPSWEKKEQPVFQQGNALVIILDLSLSMNARDIKPSRIERAKLKLIDILKNKKEGQTALIAFAGDAHTVSPLTIDSKTIMSLLPALDSSIMPLSGSHLLDALSSAKQLFKNAGFAQGDILLLSDGIDSSQQDALEKHIKKMHQQGYRFSVIGVGSLAGSPIPMRGQSGFIKDQSGQVVLSKLVPERLKNLAIIGGGSYYKLSLDDSDFQSLLKQKIDQNNNLMDQDKQLEQWLDAGVYLSLLLIPLALLRFRKGLLSLFICLTIASSFITEPSYADEQLNRQVKKHWQQLWTTAEQQAQKSFNAKDYQAAADKFSDQQWKASSYYRAGDYAKALEQYSLSDDAKNLYNRGNTLANMNKFSEAIKAYEEVLKKDTELEPTIKTNTNKNLDYINELLAQQKQQAAKENADKKNDNSDQNSEDQDQQQQKSSDDSSKSSDANSDQSEQNKSEKSKSQGSDTEGDDSGEKGEDSSEPENDDTSDSKSPTQAKENEPLSPDEAKTSDKPKTPDKLKTPDKAKPIQEQQNKAQEDSEQASQTEPTEDDKNNQENADGTKNDVLSQLSQEEQQSLKQWLQRIPDNPGDLLRIKFRNNTLLKQTQTDSSEMQYEGNPW